MDLLYSQEVYVIQHLQANYWGYQNFLNFMSAVGDPQYVFSVYFPLWFQLSQNVGTKMIWVAVIGDWFNLIFKWILFGHRPYWWVQETQYYSNLSVPQLEQFPITCETGPGSPSGHAMGSASVWYVMITAVLGNTRLQKEGKQCTAYWLVWSVLWIAFWVIQISVCASRIFVATHFPHQVVLGVIGGILVAEAFEHIPSTQAAKLKTYIQINLFLLLFALCFYLALKLINIDLLWSVRKAKKWCANPEWIHLGTTPLAGLVRSLGALFGLGLAINSQMFIQSCKGKSAYKICFKMMCITTSLTTLQLFDLVKIPTHIEMLFYVLCFCKNATIPLTVVALIPYSVHLLMRSIENKVN
ncbi:glucose-6-phosphatase 2-like [Heptranchias perlo]|uniref:glucose-6-phosphatase 2-like n=1 Tax=Heptranchias perlo TaxID=212740 RepID=UPI00355A334D